MVTRKQELYHGGGINGAALKWIAIITMFIDHFAAIFLASSNSLYLPMRSIGRLAFPIFAFLIIQGYQHTSNLQNYLGRMFVFALLSEIPFDLAFYDTVYYSGHQNIFFTLVIGVMTIALYEKFERDNNILLKILPVIVGGLLAEFLNTDYGIYGVALIFGLGILRENKIYQTIFGVLMGLVQVVAASLAFIPLWFYNGERGQQNKWFFYLFYPVHFILFYVLRVFLLE
jgi:hypothetical protein